MLRPSRIYALSKTKLRRSLLQTRQAMSVDVWRETSDRICEHLAVSPQYTQAQTILAYFSVRQEPDLSPLFKSKQHWGFPRCVDKSLSWHSWQPGEALQTGSYGIFEPHANSPALSSEQVDLILVPAVACDKSGYRLGYGGGFYDRMLSLSQWESKPTIGIVFDFAYLPQLPVDSWDRKLHGVCTESGLKMAQ
jgi:5-formyltetrahydrofolate cyclo-ligase